MIRWNTQPVSCHDFNTKKLIRVFESQSEASRWLISLGFVKENGRPRGTLSSIGKCIKGKFDSYAGFVWKPISFYEYEKLSDFYFKQHPLDYNRYIPFYKIKVFDLFGQYLISFKDTNHAVDWTRKYCNIDKNTTNATIRGGINSVIIGTKKYYYELKFINILNDSEPEELNVKAGC